MPLPEKKNAYSEIPGGTPRPLRFVENAAELGNKNPGLWGALLFVLFPIGLWLVRGNGWPRRWLGVSLLVVSAGGFYICFPPFMLRTNSTGLMVSLLLWNIFTTIVVVTAYVATRHGWGLRAWALDNIALDVVLCLALVGSLAVRAAMGVPTTPGWLGVAVLVTALADWFREAHLNSAWVLVPGGVILLLLG